MLIWGWTSKEIKSLYVETPCSHCQHDGLIYRTMQNFFTLFFIPTIPLKKFSSLFCENCGSEFPAHLFKFEEPIESKTPWWAYSGALVFGSLILACVTLVSIENKNTKTYLANPHAGDTLIFKLEEEKKTPYVFMKITGVDNLKIATLQSKYQYSRSRDASAALHSKDAEDAKYFPDTYEIPVQEFKELDVVSIERKG